MLQKNCKEDYGQQTRHVFLHSMYTAQIQCIVHVSNLDWLHLLAMCAICTAFDYALCIPYDDSRNSSNFVIHVDTLGQLVDP